ncbi:peptide chain release factor [Dorcoceras hygrometricum]|uniref:Peptide chain release factor n=1 Tax=Dorcoceras hygrometricum TaxID=472368 RepID=A0A2Z7A404_9LAMI|nr:peptide chain release factor [Dorcoceras hygrometricum]
MVALSPLANHQPQNWSIKDGFGKRIQRYQPCSNLSRLSLAIGKDKGWVNTEEGFAKGYQLGLSKVYDISYGRRLTLGKQNSTTTQPCNLINHHHLVIFRYDDSADHHKAVWYSGATTQLATTSKQRWTFQARRLSRPISTCKGIQLSIESGSIGMHECTSDSCLINAYITRTNSTFEEQKNYWSTIAKTLKYCNCFALLNSGDSVSKMVPIESPIEDELSATNLNPDDGEK